VRASEHMSPNHLVRITHAFPRNPSWVAERLTAGELDGSQVSRKGLRFRCVGMPVMLSFTCPNRSHLLTGKKVEFIPSFGRCLQTTPVVATIAGTWLPRRITSAREVPWLTRLP